MTCYEYSQKFLEIRGKYVILIFQISSSRWPPIGFCCFEFFSDAIIELKKNINENMRKLNFKVAAILGIAFLRS